MRVNIMCYLARNKCKGDVMITAELTKREQELEKIVYRDTYKKIELSYYNEIGIDAYTLSLDLYLDRANISRTLNHLTRKGYLSKINGRPTRFFSKRAFEYFFKNLFVPEEFSTDESIEDYIRKNSKSIPLNRNEFTHIIGHLKHESLYHAINAIKAAIAYPSYGIDILLIGEYSTGKRSLIDAAQKHAISHKIIKNKKHILEYDCSYIQDAQSLIDDITKIMLKNNEHTKIILHNLDSLNLNELELLLSFITKKHLWDEKSHQFTPLKASFIGSFNEGSYHEKLEFANSFFAKKIQIPNYDDRPILEKLKTIIKLFQKEVDKIGKTLKLNHNILNCFVLSEYEYNFFELQNNINITIANALFREPSHLTMIELTFDDIPDLVLDKMKNSGEDINELYKIHGLLKVDNFYFYPNTANDLIHNLDKLFNYNDEIKEEKEYISLINSYAERLIKDSINYNVNIAPHIYDELGITDEDINLNHEQISNRIVDHLSNMVNQIKNKEYRSIINQNIQKEISEKGTNLFNKIETHNQIEIPFFEKCLIDESLRIAKTIVDKQSVDVLIITNLKTVANNYERFVKSLKNPREDIHVLSVQEINEHCKSDAKRRNFINNTLSKINQGKGVVILIESDLESYMKSLLIDIETPYLMIPNINIHLLEQVVRLSQDYLSFLNDFKKFNHENDIEHTDVATEDRSMINLIKKEILDESLLFLNPNKILDLSLEIYNRIIIDLQKPYNETKAVQFIVHTSFMLERIVLGEKLTYRNTNTYLKEHGKEFNIISKELQPINQQFGVNIPTEELIYITEIFIN